MTPCRKCKKPLSDTNPVHFANITDIKPCPGSWPEKVIAKPMSIRPEFSVHRLNPQGLSRADDIATSFSELLAKIEAVVPASRERSLVVTKLQEACFWAKRGMALQKENEIEAIAPSVNPAISPTS